MQLQDLLQSAAFLPSLSLHKLLLFIRLAHAARSSIEISLLRADTPPENLPPCIRQVLSLTIKEDATVIDRCWSATKEYLWTLSLDNGRLHDEEISLFNEHTLELSLCE